MIRLPLWLILTIFLTGCATVAYPPRDLERISQPGIYHEVLRGQTLWEISRIYDVKLENIINANRLPDASKLEIGQLIFIPEKGGVTRRPEKISSLESFVWPVRGTVISYFGSVSNMARNKGIDIAAQYGNDIVASRSGKVIFASDRLKGYGNTIIIDHHDGFQTVYAYNKENLVAKDQNVKRGEAIAKVGKTGRASGPTLHFEIRKDHKPQNPFYYLP